MEPNCPEGSAAAANSEYNLLEGVQDKAVSIPPPVAQRTQCVPTSSHNHRYTSQITTYNVPPKNFALGG